MVWHVLSLFTLCICSWRSTSIWTCVSKFKSHTSLCAVLTGSLLMVAAFTPFANTEPSGRVSLITNRFLWPRLATYHVLPIGRMFYLYLMQKLSFRGVDYWVISSSVHMIICGLSVVVVFIIWYYANLPNRCQIDCRSNLHLTNLFLLIYLQSLFTDFLQQVIDRFQLHQRRLGLNFPFPDHRYKMSESAGSHSDIWVWLSQDGSLRIGCSSQSTIWG